MVHAPFDEPAPDALIRIVIADDHALVRAGIRLLLASATDMEVVGEARDGRELVVMAEALRADVVITDLTMPGGDGIAAIEALHEHHPQMKLIALSMHDTPDFIRRAIRAGADSYLLKGAPGQEMEQAVRAVVTGSAYFSPQVSKTLAAAEEPRPEDLLTPRQIEILRLLAGGKSAKEAAFALNLSSKTVDVHRAAIMKRLGLGDIASLTLYAVRMGLVDAQDQPPGRPRR